MMSRNLRVSRRLGFRRNALMVSCASAAIAASLLLPSSASAQAAPGAFQGSIQSSTGTYTRATSGTNETITIGSPTATLNWSPYDGATGGGPIDFLPSGHIATFINDPGLTSDYTVLNRIVPVDPSRPIQFDGTVLSRLTDGTNTVTGGHVWFYSPGGILLGSTAIFDVGSLLLTTADLPNGFTADSNGFSAFFSAPSNSLSSIQVMPGAQISALQQNSYVAMVAPRVEQGGTVKVDGSAAYVAATSLTMTMNQGLFDIQVDLGGGSDDSQGIVHSGSTTGGDTASLSANHKVYMVAVPKNNAMTMLLGGTAGFDASVAGYENGQIVLSSGYNIDDSTGTPQRGYLSDLTLPGGIDIGSGTYLSDLTAISNGSINVGASDGGIDFKGNVALNSYDAWDEGTITVEASGGNTINVGGNLSMFSANPLYIPSTQLKLLADPGASILIAGNLDMAAQSYPGYGGSAQVDAFGGTISIGGGASVNVDGIDDPAIDYGDQRRGGTINISSTDYVDNQGSITAAGMVLSANGVGHDNGGSSDWQLVDARGGTIYVNTGQGGDIFINGNFSAVASAFAGQQGTVGYVGGEGRGGEVHVGSVGGTFHIAGNATLNADGTGGDGASGIDGGAGFGGIADLYSGGDGVLHVDGNVLTSAGGTGGSGQNGGFGKGGHSGVGSTGGSVLIGGNIYAAAEGTGGNASMGFGGTGGGAGGGVAYVEADSSEGGFAGSITGTTATISSNATGGTGGAGNGDNVAAGAGGSATAGQYEGFNTGGSYALADVNGASLSLTNVVLTSTAFGGMGGAGGAGQTGGIGGAALGGTAQAGTWNPTATTDRTGSATFANVNVISKGQGGNGGSGALGGDGGTGTGGGAIFAAAGDTSASYVSLNATGIGGNGANGGAGYGGSGDTGGVLLAAAHDSNMTITGAADLYAMGQGGFASSGSGGTGYGGDAVIQVLSGGSITGGDDGLGGTLPTGDIWVYNKGQGGDGGNAATGGSGGDGYGGNTWLLADGLLHTGEMVFRTLGVGGAGGAGSAGAGGDGGYGQGGVTIVSIGATGAFDSWEFTGFTNGVGGDVGAGTTASGNGGSGHGGSNTVTIDGEASVIGCMDCGPQGVPLGFVVTAYGLGANGQNGGDATGGSSSITVNGSLSSGSIVQASGQAGGGIGAVNGGNAYGGSGSITVAGTLTSNTIFAGSTATASNGGSGNGGSAFGGESEIRSIGNGSIQVADLSVRADATGGSGVNGGDAFGGSAEAGAMDSSAATLTVTNLATVSATGTGGSGIASGFGGDGYGGLAGIHSGIEEADISGTVLLKDVLVDASGFGGQGGTAGSGQGGDAHAGTLDGIFTVTGTLTGRAQGWGGAGIGSAGGTGAGGDFLIGANLQGDLNPATANIAVADISVVGFGGQGGAGSAGGDGYGGSFDISVGTADSSLTIGTLTANVKGQGGDGGGGPTGGAGGFGYGGSSMATILGTMNGGDWAVAVRGIGGNGGASVTGNGGDGGYGEGGSTSFYTGSESMIDAASYSTSANGIGGDGGSGAIAGNGGEAQGGYNESVFNGTAVFTGDVVTTAFAQAGIGATGGDATGGISQITVNGSLSGGLIQSTGQALGGAGSAFGGNAFGGSGTIEVNGTMTAGHIIVGSVATGGNGATGGDALGGTSRLNNFGSLTAGDVQVSANATGGNSANDLGGDAFAGEAVMETHGTTSLSGNVQISSNGLGGNGLTGGGNASGYSAALKIGGGTASLTGATTISATGTGGNSANGTGGTATGGYARTSTFNGASSTIDDLTVDSSGIGGNGATGGIGYGSESVEGWGGSVVQALDTGSSITLTGQTTIVANGIGGSGSSGAGGDGYGGSTHLNAIQNPITVQNLLMAANGVGGSGLNAGGNGWGGNSILFANGSPVTISTGGIIQANASGGDGGTGTGGNAVAGYADVESTAGAALGGGSLTVSADASGGNGGVAGGASAGLVNLVADAVESGLPTSIAFDSITLTASGSSGAGSNPFGAGGFITVLAPGGSISANTLTATANGTTAGGDIAMTSSLDPANAAGSMSFGGVTAFANGGFGEISLTAGSGTAIHLGSAGFSATGAGGEISLNAGDCGCTAGNIFANELAAYSGGDIDFESIAGGKLQVGGTLSLDAAGALTFTSDGAGGTVHAGTIDAHGGSIASNLPLTGGSILLNAAADATITTANAADFLSVTSGGALNSGNLHSGGNLALNSGGSMLIGNLTVGGHSDLSAGGDLAFGNVTTGTFSFDSDGTVSGGNISANSHIDGDASGAIILGNLTVGPNLPGGDDFSVGIASATSIDVGTVTGPGSIGFATLGALSTGNLTAGNSILAMVGGDISTGSLTTGASGEVYFGDSSMFLAAGGPDDFDPALVFGTDPVQTSGSIAIGGPVSTNLFRAAAGGDFNAGTINSSTQLLVSAGGNLTANSLSAGSDAMLTADGNMNVNSLHAGGSIIAGADGNFSASSISAGGDLIALADGSLSIGDASVGSTANFFAGGLATFTGTISAPSIAVTSSDITVDEGASLGVFGVTDAVLLNAVSDQAVIIGDQGIAPAAAGQYVLNEDGDIRANAVIVNAIGVEGPTDVKIYDVDIGGSATPAGGISTVLVNTAGSILVDGQVNFANAAAGDMLTLAAGQNIEVNTDNGGIQMTDSLGHYGGTLTLFAPNVWIGDGALLAQLEVDPNFAGRDAALKTNNGPVVPDGYVRAGGIAVSVADSFFVQNSGTADVFAGLTVGDGGLTVVSTGDTATAAAAPLVKAAAATSGALINIFGHQIRSNGTTVSGKDFTNAVTLVGTFASGSSINDCTVGNCSEVPPTPPPSPPPSPPPPVAGSESILGPIGAITEPQEAGDADQADDGSDDDSDDDDSKGSASVDPTMYLINTAPMHIDRTIDQPITSGNDPFGGPQ